MSVSPERGKETMDEQHGTHPARYGMLYTQTTDSLVHTLCILLIRIFDNIICVASPDITGTPTLHYYASICKHLCTPHHTIYVASSDVYGPHTHPICVDSSDVSVPMHSTSLAQIFLGQRNESVITWAAPQVMNHGSGGMRLDGSRWWWCLRLASPNNNAQLHKEGEEERGNKGGKRWGRG
ncbi:hypothetical protein F2Q68_00010888 [Brassica cretica]|uniref:Uncharacterized protein n=1 Tax=Brassica cretica TaxID=69181 RepID=A0A8S9KW72_BRACR|nr:hypothetical protein F2Q68_00010888 [Brassica cretica]